MVFRAVLILLVVLIAAALIVPLANYSRHDYESLELGEEARKSAPGKFVRLSYGNVHYDLKGPESGRPVVLVHGFSVPFYLWDPTFEALAAAGYRVLRYDLFGRGFSDRPPLRYDADLFDRQLAELLDALQIKGEVDLVGASMGGPIVAGFACRHGERVRTVSLFDPGFSRGSQLPFKLRTPFLGEYFMAVDIAPGLPASQREDFLHPEKFPNWPDRYRPQMQYKGFRAALLSTLRHYLTADWSQEYTCLGGRPTPVFLVWGKHDRDVPFEVSKDVLAAIPRAEFLPVEDAGHVPFLEHPEIVEPALTKFLAAH